MENLDGRVWAFLEDDRFIRWVRTPDEETIAWWEKWMAANPGEVTYLFKAREIARDLVYTETPPDAETLSQRIWTGVEDDLGAAVVPMTGNRRKKAWYWAAACLAGLAVAGAGIAYFRPASAPAAPVVQQVARRMVKQKLEQTNGTESNQQVYLVDGTKITLQPGAGIRHDIYLQKDKREVYLDGNAFFEIAKDADRPFYVYTKDLVVRVLGTSFKVITNKVNGDISVVVESGKVSVSKKANPGRQSLILEHNQQAWYKAQTQDLVGAAGDRKDLAVDMRPAAPAMPFSFEETPMVQVFKRLENAYGIPLHYDEKTFSACKITTSLVDETFEDKLKILCEATGANYRIDSAGVWIDGHGCKN